MREADKWGQSKGCTIGQGGGPTARAISARDHWEFLDRRSKTLKGEVLDRRSKTLNTRRSKGQEVQKTHNEEVLIKRDTLN